MTRLKDRAADKATIKAPALNLTLGTLTTISLATVVTAFDETYQKIFGFDPGTHPNVTAALLIALVAAFALITVADLFARAIASAQRDLTHLAPAPGGWKAAISRDNADDFGYTVTAMRFRKADELEYLLVKDGVPPIWKTQAEITLQIPGP